MRAALIAIVMLSSVSAHADAIRPARNCPAGWESRRVGHGARCFPVACTSDAQCNGGAQCREVHRCWMQVPISQGRMRRVPPPSAWVPRDLTCEGADDCREDDDCRLARECVAPRPVPVPPGAATTAACSAAHPGAMLPPIAIGVAYLWWRFRSRRR